MKRSAFLASVGAAGSIALAGCLGSLPLSEEDAPSECPDLDLETPLAYDVFDFEGGILETDQEEVVKIFTSRRDVAQFIDETDISEALETVDFETQYGVIAERSLHGNWGSHHVIGVDQQTERTIELHVCTPERPESPPNDVVTTMSIGLLVELEGEVPTDGQLQHHY
ncbi:hypothetical protein [Natronorubrum texcoconense]|uniref:Lipoprotein n=1 Tax=Natronorubrum texcoconense TaxID=1095776 RepID=A0A1G9AIY1_9EURY|nr:hypothetical protein [Natronorubrum texcoconense]SDK26764.1 hypothetical protein SAMN04515672_2744 [Natronorubrum texcoconense]